MPRIVFTDRSIRAIQPTPDGTVEYFDTDRRIPGFGLRAFESGRISWFVLYRYRGRSRRLTLGLFPTLGLANARAKAREALATVLAGDDPAGNKQAHRHAPSFKYLVEQYMERHAKPRKRTWKADERAFRLYAPKDWWTMNAQDIRRADVRDVLDSIVGRAPIQANRVLASFRKLFNFGVSRDLLEQNPCWGIEQPAPARQRDRVLTPNELRQVWQAIEEELDRATAALFKLYLLTAQRGGELRSMAWVEVDFETGWWVVPSGRAKNRLAHRVPLGVMALDLLRGLRETGNSPWVFATPSDRGYRETAHKATSRIRQRSGVDFVPHDLRRTTASYMTSLGISRLVVGKILNHVERGVTAVYDRYSYDREKRAAVDLWTGALSDIVGGSDNRLLSTIAPAALH